MKPYCRHCQTYDHWTTECPDLNPSHGTPRAEAKAPAPPPKPKRRPLVPDRYSTKAAAPIAPPAATDTAPSSPAAHPTSAPPTHAPSGHAQSPNTTTPADAGTRSHPGPAADTPHTSPSSPPVANPTVANPKRVAKGGVANPGGRPRVANPSPSTLRSRKHRAKFHK